MIIYIINMKHDVRRQLFSNMAIVMKHKNLGMSWKSDNQITALVVTRTLIHQ